MHEQLHIRMIHPSERWEHSVSLMQMHHDRKRVFVDRLGWRLPTGAGWLEVDEFDHDFAVYLMAVDDNDRHLGSVRLLPTTRRHMLQAIFPDLCPGGAPCGEDVWEISRFLATPGRCGGTAILRIYRLLAAALMEFAELNGASRFTLVAETKRMPALLSIGWTVHPLSLPTLVEGEWIEAAEIVVGSGGWRAAAPTPASTCQLETAA
jgi:N-acyl-L-homoserine lactone synthetase